MQLTTKSIEGEKEKKSKYYREWYLKNGRKRYPEKIKAYARVAYAVSRGYLIKPSTCPSCGRSEKIEAHHEDYLKPLEVLWLCNRCHRKLHTGY